MLKVLIIGLGSIAKKHINVLFDLRPNTKIYALRSNLDADSLKGVKNIFSLGDAPDNLDFVIISNPTSEHYSTIYSVLPLNIPIFIEKPILSSLNKSKNLERDIEKSRSITYVACNLRFHPAIARLKEELKFRTPVEINLYAGSYLPDWRPGRDYRKVYSAKSKEGGGVHLDLIHEIDYCYYLFGKPLNLLFYGRKKSKLEIDSLDIAHYTLEYENLSIFITLNYYRKNQKREIEIVWEDEEWTIDLLKNTIYSSEEDILYHEPYDIIDTYKSQMVYFLEHISLAQQPMNALSEGIKVLNICLNYEDIRK